ncbi:hypothetical protein [Chamaesiphon sp.]|uniref:hypothetical protein n=1 Tax=Chamaesiphon sp. TaxID=2814140 RepID=UPI0035937148
MARRRSVKDIKQKMVGSSDRRSVSYPVDVIVPRFAVDRTALLSHRGWEGWKLDIVATVAISTTHWQRSTVVPS